MNMTAVQEKRVSPEEIWQLLKKQTVSEILKSDHRPEVLYALSEEQKNLLDWYPFEKGKTLLECRAGYGTLTTLFLQKGLNVTSIVESQAQRRVIEKRCGKTENLMINELAEGFRKTECLEAFSYDYVVLIGAASEEEMEIAWGYVKPGGILLTAADNRRSLLRICSGTATETAAVNRYADRAATSDTAGKGGVTLAGCEALAEQLKVRKTELYFPLPDWRLPKVVYSEGYLAGKKSPEFPVAYYEPPECLIHEAEAYRELLKMGEYRGFARSYLLIWEK